MENTPPNPLSPPRWAPIAIAIILIAGTVWLWRGLVEDGRNRTRESVSLHTLGICLEISERLKTQVFPMERMIRRWTTNGKPSEAEWRSEAELFLELYPGIVSIGWIDATMGLRWTASPASRNPPVAGSAADSAWKDWQTWGLTALEDARFRREVRFTPAFDVNDGRKRFMSCISIGAGRDSEGFLASIFDLNDMLDSILRDSADRGFAVSILEGEREICRNESANATDQTAFERKDVVSFKNLSWTVVARPTARLFARERSYYPEMILGAGCSSALLLSLATFFAQKSGRHAQNVDFINRQLSYEIIERQRKEEALRKIQNELDQRVQDRTADLTHANQELHQEIARRERAQTAMRNSEHKFRSVAESANDAIISTDRNGTIVFWNNGAKNMFQHSAEEAVGQGIDLIIPEAFRDSGPRRFIASTDVLPEKMPIEINGLRRNGTELNMEFSLASWKTGEETFFTFTFHDITQHKQVEEVLAQARDAALGAAQLKSEFLANVSHEIRTPLNGVIGMAGLLLQTRMTPRQQEFAHVVRSCADDLLALINDILDFSKIEAGKLRFEKLDFNLFHTVESTVDLLAERAQTKGIELATHVPGDVPILLRGDPSRLRQVIMNLVANAIKFTDHGEVVVRVALESETGTHAVIRFLVSDTGIGIAEDTAERLFQPFTQADASTARKYGGTGLGLAISKQLITVMGGEIGVQSAPGKGSTFWFTAHFDKQPALHTEDAAGDKTFHGIRGLVIDDNQSSREIVAGYLGDLGMNMAGAGSGAEALRLLREAAESGQPYQVALVDIAMPQMDGIALAMAIKSDPLIAATRLIAVTLPGQQHDVEPLREVGIEACLAKPAKRSQLMECVAHLLEHRPTAKTPVFVPGNPRVKRDSVAIRRKGDPVPQQPVRVLVAEDNVVNQKVILHQLEELGYPAEAVANGFEACEALARIPYDLVLMDCQMPEMDGYEATAAIRRRQGATKHTPIIAVTAHATEEDRKKCLAAGMDDYLSKPVKTEDLEQVLRRWQQSGDAVQSPSKTPPVNLKWARDVADGDAEKTSDLMLLYLRQTTEQIEQLGNAIRTQAFKEVERLAHSCAGSSATCGMTTIVPLLRELERMGGDQQLAEAPALLQKIGSEFSRIRHYLRESKIVTVASS